MGEVEDKRNLKKGEKSESHTEKCFLVAKWQMLETE